MTIEHCLYSLRNKGLYFCIKEASKYLFPVRWISDKGLMDRIYQKKTYQYLKRKYIPKLDSFVYSEPDDSAGLSPIWIAWLQGEENAPHIVRNCIESVRKYSSGRPVIIVTWDNIASYVDIPQYIIERLNKRQMQYAQFSDYLRVALLCKWGGIWIDSTVLLTGPLPEIMLNSSLFFFKGSIDDIAPIRISSWFIVSQQGNLLIQKLKYLLECYWKREHRLMDYYLFHIFVSCLIDSDNECRKIWDDMHFAENLSPHRLQANLFKPYSEKIFNDICSGSNIHKLTYKFRNPSFAKNEGTVYNYLFGR